MKSIYLYGGKTYFLDEALSPNDTKDLNKFLKKNEL